jgi:hypothetical protein
VAWSKFDPHAPPAPGDDDPLRPSTPAAGRRARALRYATWITSAMTVAGYGLMLYWIFG